MKLFMPALLPIACLVTLTGCSDFSGPGGGGETVDLKIADTIEVGALDPKGEAIVAAAQAFLETLDETQRETVVYAFDDNSQRARWSNFPVSFVERGGLLRKDMSESQLIALDAMLGEVLSADGLRNAKLQMAADDLLTDGDGPAADFGQGFYYVAFLGEPSADKPWMVQFGGHHLALNITIVGDKASFSPMLTGGQPLTVTYEGAETYITRKEVEAGEAFLASLDETQRETAIRATSPINLLSGPGEHGTSIAAEGIAGSELTAQQQDLLLKVVQARIGQFNSRDSGRTMDQARGNIDDLHFGWWGPIEPRGAAYFRITGPGLILEYGPQEMAGDDITEHAHNMYRDPTNDYGASWIAAE